MSFALELRGVSRSFDGRPVLRELDLAIPAGQVVALLGPSGAGKTTLLRVLSGVLPPSRGSVRVMGQPLEALGWRERRAARMSVGLLYQNDGLVPGLNVAHNVLVGRLGQWSLAESLLSLLKPRELDRVRAALGEVGLEEKLEASVAALSGGERQRVGIARLLLQDPAIVLADEPAAFLDPRLGPQVVDLLVGLARGRARTLIVALHDIDLVSDRFDRVLALKDGAWFWEGPPAALHRERIAEIYAAERKAPGE